MKLFQKIIKKIKIKKIQKIIILTHIVSIFRALNKMSLEFFKQNEYWNSGNCTKHLDLLKLCSYRVRSS